MISEDPDINDLHRAYCEAMELDLVLLATYERWYYEAIRLGLTPDLLQLCIHQRKLHNRIAEPRFRKGLELKHLIRDPDNVAVVLNEVAVAQAEMRKKLFTPGKAQVLRATNRPDQPRPEDARPIGDYIQIMRKAVNDPTI